MRELADDGIRHALSLEVLSALQRCATNEPLLPSLAALSLWAVNGRLAQFVPLFLSTRISSISIIFAACDHHKAVVASVVTAFPSLCPNLQKICLQ